MGIGLEEMVVVDRSYLEKLSFEIKSATRSFLFVTETLESQRHWLHHLCNVLKMKIQSNPHETLNQTLGWEHIVCRGTIFSGAVLGDLQVIESTCKTLKDTKERIQPKRSHTATNENDKRQRDKHRSYQG